MRTPLVGRPALDILRRGNRHRIINIQRQSLFAQAHRDLQKPGFLPNLCEGDQNPPDSAPFNELAIHLDGFRGLDGRSPRCRINGRANAQQHGDRPYQKHVPAID